MGNTDAGRLGDRNANDVAERDRAAHAARDERKQQAEKAIGKPSQRDTGTR